MTHYYFDIETTGFNPIKDKIITIQFQKLDYIGKPVEKLIILQEWQSSEEQIVKQFHSLFFGTGVWDFIPIGQNLIFDFNFLFTKFRQYGLSCPGLSEYIYSKPFIDIKYSLIMMNELSFKGAGLDKMTNKLQSGKEVPEWHRMQDFNRITEYISQEAESFLEFLESLISKLLELKHGKK